MTILVTGGKGVLGRRVVNELIEHGHEVVVATRHPRDRSDGVRETELNLATGAGLPAALVAIDTIIHAATDATHAKQVDIAGTATMLEAAAGAGIAHILYPSIVGIDHHAFAYYRTKRVVEGLIEQSGVPFTIQRTTQFHQFPARLADAQRKLPVVLAPSHVEFQVLDVGVAASRLVQLAEMGPSGRMADIGGGEALPVAYLIRSYLRARGSHRPVVPVRVPGQTGRDFRAGLQLSDDHSGATPTWEEFLAGVRDTARPAAVR